MGSRGQVLVEVHDDSMSYLEGLAEAHDSGADRPGPLIINSTFLRSYSRAVWEAASPSWRNTTSKGTMSNISSMQRDDDRR
ncbi:hypothetical protein Q5P01_004035 [Channa striata]|uniref:Uncharacterized protein n=1 Tax=Channa striata TaxID=64152 RepID=A0AA88NTK9_CHASR|nr:hypothetical protein Q5P01_004035 [Channa striata]